MQLFKNSTTSSENSVDPDQLASEEASSSGSTLLHPTNEFNENNENLTGLFRPNKKISVFRVTGLKILGRVGTHIFFLIYNFMHFEKHFAFQNA